MSIEITVKQTGLFKKELPFSVLQGDELAYGWFDGLCLEQGKIGDTEFILYHPAHIGRGFSVIWKKGEKNQVDLRLPTPAAKEEINDFYDTVERIAAFWKRCRIEQDGTPLDLEDIPAQRVNMKDFNLRTLIDFCQRDDYEELTLFCAFWPLVLGPEEKRLLGKSNDLSLLREFLHEQQNMDVYYAKPSFYRSPSGTFGVYALTENTRSVFPNKPYVPFGVNNPETGDALEVGRWFVSLVSITKKSVLGQIPYDALLASIANTTYYDGGNFIIESLSLEEMEELVAQHGTTI